MVQDSASRRGSGGVTNEAACASSRGEREELTTRAVIRCIRPALRLFSGKRPEGAGRWPEGTMAACFARYPTAWLLLFVATMSVPTTSAAPPAAPSKAVEKEAEQIRAVLEANFQACNNENVDALMATCSPEPKGTEEFADEARTLFKETDVYLRLADFELLELKPPYASARVVQITLPADEKDRTSGDARQVFYRGNSALLPRWETCEYTQTFKKENGRWKLYAITTKPKPAVWPPDNPNALRLDNMPAPQSR